MRTCCGPHIIARTALATLAVIRSTISADCPSNATFMIPILTTSVIVAVISGVVDAVSVADAVAMLSATDATDSPSGAVIPLIVATVSIIAATACATNAAVSATADMVSIEVAAISQCLYPYGTWWPHSDWTQCCQAKKTLPSSSM